MPNHLIPAAGSETSVRPVGVRSASGLDRQTTRALTTIERNTLVRVAAVRSHALVQQQKVREVNDLAREAMTDHALLANRATVLAGEDPFLADELKFYRDIARIGTGELIADLVSDYCQEGR